MYRVSLDPVPSENEVYKDSLVNWIRFNHRDIPNALYYVGLCAVLLLLAWGGNTLAHHLLVNHVTSCGTVGCHPTGTLPPYHGPGPTLPPYKP